MNKITKTMGVLALSLVVVINGCKKDDDLYTNPNLPVKATPATMLANLEVNTFMNFEGLVKTTSILIQHNSGVGAQFITDDRYDLTEDQMDNYWNGVYAGTLVNAKLLSDNFGAENPYYNSISKILMAMNLGLATDLWGDVPYSDAFQGQTGTLTPKFDSQQQILATIQSLLDEAISLAAQPSGANAELPTGDDYIFGGDMGMWTKTAWTLKARYANRLSLKDPAGSATNVLTYLANGISSSSENCMTMHFGTGADANQFNAFQQQRALQVLACATLVDSMKLRPSDIRLYYYFDSTGLGDVIGNELGQSDDQVSSWGSYIAGSGSTSTPLVTFAEAKFLEAEAHMRLSQTTDAANALNDAIQASCDEVTSGAFSGASLATYTPGNVNLSRIMYEKWIAMFMQFEAYDDYRRTGFPNLTIRPGASRNYIPQRMPTALTERVANPNAQPYTLDVKVWWAQP